MKEYLTDTEKRMLFAALGHEIKFLESYGEEYKDLIDVVYDLSFKFENDRLFAKIYKDGENNNAKS